MRAAKVSQFCGQRALVSARRTIATTPTRTNSSDDAHPLAGSEPPQYPGRVGTIFYGGSATPIHIEDRALAHLKVVIATKLRRSESFTVSWRHPDDQPTGRSTIWLHPSIPLRFVFEDPEPEELSRQWIEDLAHSANSSGGIMLVAEYFETAVDDGSQAADPDLSVGKVEIEELSVDKLKVAGTVLGGDPDLEARRLLADSQPA